MPASVAETTAETKEDDGQPLCKVLKTYILRERARKKQEREAEVEEERLRKEREAREQQDVMTLGETRDQISQLEAKLTQLKEEKHQLFLQLKKVLNEDDNRRRQLVKENDMHLPALQSIQSAFVPQTLYISSAVPRGPQMAQQPGNFKSTIKRPRSPSPQPVPVSMYQVYPSYKPPGVGTAAYQTSPQNDGRRNSEMSRAVLWNKPSHYANQTSAFYPVPHQEISPVYFPLSGREQAGRSVYDPPRQAFHMEQKLPDHYQSLRNPPSHMVHARDAIPVMAGQPKSNSISYAMRTQGQFQPAPAPGALYTNPSRPMYQSPGAMGGYLPRD